MSGRRLLMAVIAGLVALFILPLVTDNDYILALGISFCCARWEVTGEVQRLYIYSAFSVACLLLLFVRIYVAPALAYALTFLAL